MKYIVMNTNGDIYNDEYNTRAEAIARAEYRWSHLTEREKRKDDLIVLDSVNPDEEAEDHFDGNPIWENGKELEGE